MHSDIILVTAGDFLYICIEQLHNPNQIIDRWFEGGGSFVDFSRSAGDKM